MFSHISISNTINKVLNNNNVVYLGIKNLFYSLLSDSRFLNYSVITNTAQPFIGVIHDDPLVFSQHAESLYLQYHVTGLLFFHQEAPQALKKEDKHILSKKLNNTIKVFFSEEIKNSWGLATNNDDSFLIPYGYKTNNTNIAKNDVLVLNFSNNQTLTNLYKYISNVFNNSALLTTVDNYDSMIDYIRNYRVVVSIENIYDTICCAANVPCVLTNTRTKNSLSNIYNISNINDINNQIAEILKNQDLLPPKILDENINNFYQSMNHILSKLHNKVYKYDA